MDGLPEVWDNGTGHEVAAALAISLQGADKLANLAWTLQARLPGIGAKLADGTVDIVKAGIIAKELFVLDDAQAAEAEALILDELAGKTPGRSGNWPPTNPGSRPGRRREAARVRRAGRRPGPDVAGEQRGQRAGRLRPAHRRGPVRQREHDARARAYRRPASARTPG